MLINSLLLLLFFSLQEISVSASESPVDVLPDIQKLTIIANEDAFIAISLDGVSTSMKSTKLSIFHTLTILRIILLF